MKQVLTEEQEIIRMRRKEWMEYFDLRIWPELGLGVGFPGELLMMKIAREFIEEDLKNGEFDTEA